MNYWNEKNWSNGKLLVILVLQGLSSNTVQISLTVSRDSSTLWGNLKDTQLLQGLQDSSVDGTGGISVLGWSTTSVDGTTVELVQLTDTNLLSQVDVTSSGGSSLVEPSLRLLWWQFITSRGLDEINVTWNLQLTLSLQELSISVDEILCWNVPIAVVVSTW